ncbi:hypothetical protein SM124_19840 [Bacillus sp. 31A1R]|uniref:Uncharacterized protein n=1 Tax=Robertmurraya mangrovi TaxID=3098077 RepID=A0ABU5J3H0_9BACI|nr:hypothetical protein [Bacillus sp. 31A1R]MDZ5473976.1 hypothetical protein [Bacillus sp. 31A1R]
MKNLLTKSQWIVFTIVFLVTLLITSPFWLWFIKPSNQLEVLILNKTVPDDTYREHKGLVWILNNEKYVKDNNQRYSSKVDYRGFVPKDEKEYEIRPLPQNLDKYDVIYIADQYGVYEEEFYGDNELGERSNHLYGGLEEEEINQITDELIHSKGKTLIAEFNTFASPTSNSAREKISNVLNVDWTGWIGRYFSDLNSKEVPVWVKENYMASGDKWEFSGEGFVFVSKDDYVVVLEKEDLKDRGVNFKHTKTGSNHFDLKIESKYQYWFDIIEARNSDEILATYELPLTDKGKNKLEGYGLPSEFPAVTFHQNSKFASYYFAGDFADEGEVPDIYQTRGLSFWKKQFSASSSFYWSAYVPMMKSILSNGLHKNDRTLPNAVVEKDGIHFNSQTNDTYIQVQQDGKWKDLLVKGVNMGIAKPGYFPGETAISKDEYFRWFKAIGDMNANAIRVYTLHPPDFYEAFYEYNQMAEKPLYLFHGAWVNEENLVKTQDAFSKEVTADFKRELKDMVDIVHGKANIPARRGHASGEYSYDISPYVLGFMIGIEWDPGAVLQTNKKHKNIGPYMGKYFSTKNASPFEAWLAEMMDYTASYETEQYKWQHTMSFTNWVTTDLLRHPAEPSDTEDMVEVNPNHIKKTDKFNGGLFASYHVYPYYPDFLNYEEKYVNYIDQQGEKNNYAGYLHDLIVPHEMPVIVAEFGVPSSRGMTHENVHGKNQGFHSEEEQGIINRKLFESIVSEGYGGGLVFAWQDEWFKRTWNTMDYDNPDRRPYWMNVQTNEQNFGLLKFEPGEFESSIVVDGNKHDWERKRLKPIYESNKNDDMIQRVFATSDEGYLYARVDYSKNINLQEDQTYLLLNTIDGQGQTSVPINNNQQVKTDFGIDFLVKLAGEDDSRVLIDSYYDSFYYHYGNMLKMIPREKYANKKDNGVFHPVRLALNKEMVIPSSKEKIPFESYETGQLKFGDGNIKSENHDSLTDISISNDKKTIELRIPWLLLNVKDPSTKEVIGDFWKDGLEGSVNMEGIQIAVVTSNNNSISSVYPQRDGDVIQSSQTVLYTWDEWEQPTYHERLKASYHIMKDAYKTINVEESKK